MERTTQHKNFLDDDVKIINSIDLVKFKHVFRKSLVWILGIFLISVLSAYLFIRWTKPVYESTSELKLDTKSEASMLSLSTLPQVTNYDNISGEIEILKSRLFFNKVIDATDINVSYFAVGNVRTDERYLHSPIIVKEYNLYSSWYFDKKFFVEFLDSDRFRLTWQNEQGDESKILRFGETLENERFRIQVDKRYTFDENLENSQHYFIINSRSSLINYLDNNLRVEPAVLHANTIKISFRAYNQFKARDLVNAIDTLYLQYTESEKHKANQQKINFLNEQLESTEKKLEDYENYFENFTISNKTVDLSSDLRETIQLINQLDSQRFILRTRLSMIEELTDDFENDQFFIITTGHRNSLPSSIINGLDELTNLVNEKDMLLTSQNENTYAVQRKIKEIKLLKDQLTKQLNELYGDITNRLASINERKAKLESNFAELPSKSTDITKTRRYYQLYEEFYLSLMQSKAEFQISQAGTTTDFKILSTANLPDSPIHPNTPYVMAIGVITGLVLSFIFLSGRYLTHNKITTVSEIERMTNTPFLGTVPYFSREKMPVTRLVINSNPKSAVSESFRSIRTNLSFMAAGKDQKVLSVSSTVGGEGKTFICVNLGGVIALSNQKVLLIDLDMRKPKIHLAFPDGKCVKGVSTILSKQSTIEETITDTPLKNLQYIPAGPTPPNPSELLLGGTFEKMLSDLRKMYDLILLDTPPTGLVTDGIIAMQHADLPIYILRSDYSKKNFLANINRLINVNDFHNIAIILNAVKSKHGEGYGYGYGYGYYDDERKKIDFLKVWRRASV